MIVPLEPGHFTPFGVVYPDAIGWARLDPYGATEAIGGVAVGADGKVWAFVGGPAKAVDHRRAVETLRHLAAVGIDEIWADCDDRIAGAEKWMRRLGFEQSEGAWRCRLVR
jgi:hypothetical protein